MAVSILVAAFGCAVCGLSLLWLGGRLTERQYAGGMVVSHIAAGVLCAAARWTTNLYLVAGGTALFTWIWWNSRGGDGTRRRLKRWAGRFQGVRRTAPQGAS
jgi:hypothetical protein